MHRLTNHFVTYLCKLQQTEMMRNTARAQSHDNTFVLQQTTFFKDT